MASGARRKHPRDAAFTLNHSYFDFDIIFFLDNLERLASGAYRKRDAAFTELITQLNSFAFGYVFDVV